VGPSSRIWPLTPLKGQTSGPEELPFTKREQTDMGDFNRRVWIEKGKQTDHDTVILGRWKQHGKAFTGAFQSLLSLFKYRTVPWNHSCLAYTPEVTSYIWNLNMGHCRDVWVLSAWICCTQPLLSQFHHPLFTHTYIEIKASKRFSDNDYFWKRNEITEPPIHMRHVNDLNDLKRVCRTIAQFF